MDAFTRSLLGKNSNPTPENQAEAYESPMLVFIYQIFGVISLICGPALPIAMGHGRNLLLVGGGLLYGIIGAIGCFGVAQLTELIGKTEFHSRKLHSIDRHLEKIVKG